MNVINCIVLSLENGLANQFSDIPPATESILDDLAKKGVILGLTSFHSIEWMKNFLLDKRLEGIFSFLIGNSGAQYYSFRTKTAVTLCTIGVRELKKTIRSVENLPAACGVFYQNELYFDKPSPYGLAYALRKKRRMKITDFQFLDPEAHFTKIILCGSRPLLQKIEGGFTVPGLRLLHPSATVLEAVPEQCSVMNALKLAAEEFHLSFEHILYFGSSDKDIPGLLHTFGVAMKNAPLQVVQACRRITKYNAAQDGVGYLLNALRMDKTCVFRSPSAGLRQGQAEIEKQKKE